MENYFYFLSVFFVLSGLVCLVVILIDLFPRHRQSMKIMEAVWPLTGLWANWIGLWSYFKMGREKNTNKGNMDDMHMEGMHMEGMKKNDMEMSGMKMPTHPKWQSVILSTLHCGAGCTLADLIGETFTSFVPIFIGGSMLAGQWVLDYILALLIGIYFQYAAIRPMEHLPRMQVIGKAFRIDFFSLTAWQIGMYGWMAIFIFAIRHGHPLMHNSWEFWFMMQVAMFFGFFTSLPANWILMKLGIKKGM